MFCKGAIQKFGKVITHNLAPGDVKRLQAQSPGLRRIWQNIAYTIYAPSNKDPIFEVFSAGVNHDMPVLCGPVYVRL